MKLWRKKKYSVDLIDDTTFEKSADCQNPNAKYKHTECRSTAELLQVGHEGLLQSAALKYVHVCAKFLHEQVSQ